MTNSFPSPPLSGLEVVSLEYSFVFSGLTPESGSLASTIGLSGGTAQPVLSFLPFFNFVGGGGVVNYTSFDQSSFESTLSAALDSFCAWWGELCGVSLSVVQSAAHVTQIWGWSSSSLMADEIVPDSAMFTTTTAMAYPA
jgi:hypothetical protein